MDEEGLRRLLQRMAEEADDAVAVPPRMLRRANRRRGRTILIGLLVLGLAGSGAVAGLEALARIQRSTPATTRCGWTMATTVNPGNVLNQLVAVAGTGPDDVWAVGSYQHKPGGYTPPPPGTIGGDLGYGTGHMLALHWAGETWTQVALPDPPHAEAGAGLTSVLTISPDDVWVTGQTALGGRLFFEHWDGARWTLVPYPVDAAGGRPHTLAASGAHEAWFVGARNGSRRQRTLTMRWDGDRWIVVPSPSVGSFGNWLTAAVALGPNDVWAVGQARKKPLAIHWDGSTWSVVDVPLEGQNDGFVDVAAGADGKVIAIANSYRSGNGEHRTLGLVYAWDVDRWRIADRLPGADLRAVALSSGHDAWISGFSGWDTDGPLTGVLLHWDGNRIQVEGLANLSQDAGLIGILTLPEGEVWVVGIDPETVPGRIVALHRTCKTPGASS